MRVNPRPVKLLANVSSAILLTAEILDVGMASVAIAGNDSKGSAIFDLPKSALHVHRAEIGLVSHALAGCFLFFSFWFLVMVTFLHVDCAYASEDQANWHRAVGIRLPFSFASGVRACLSLYAL